MTPIEDRVISVVKLPDGRYGVQNECDLSGLTQNDEDEMCELLLDWFRIRFGRRTSNASEF